MRVPTRDYSGLQQAMQTAGQAKANLIGARAASHTLQKFDLNMRRLDAQMDALSVQNNLAWAQFGLGMAKTVTDAGLQIYSAVQQGRRTKAVNEGLDKLNAINQEETANNGWTMADDPKNPGKKIWKEDPAYAKRKQDLLDGLQEAYGLDDESLAQVQQSLGQYIINSRTQQQDAVLQRMQGQYLSQWNDTTNDLTDKYVATHAADILAGDWSGSEMVRAQYDSNPYIADKEGAWGQKKLAIESQARKQVLQATVDRRGADEAYRLLGSWNLDADTDSSLRKLIQQRAADHSAEVGRSVAAYAADVRKAVESGQDGVSWSLGYESVLNGYANRPKEDQETARQAYLTAWTSEASTVVQKELGGSLFKTASELEESYKRLEGSEMFRAMPADSKNIVLQPVIEAIEARRKDEKSVEKTVSGDGLMLFNTTAADLSAKWEKGEIGTDAFVDGLKSTMDQIVGTGSVNAEDQLKMLDYTLNVVNRGVDEQIPEWLKPAWKTGWGAIEKSIQQTLGIKDLAKTMEKNPDLYADYMAYLQDAQKRLLGWIRSGGRAGQKFDVTGFQQEVEGVKTMLGSYFVDIQTKSGTGPDGLATGGLQNGQDFNRLVTDVASMPRGADGTLQFSGETENATLRQIYAETGERLDGRSVTLFSDEGAIHTEARRLRIDARETPPAYASSPTGQTLQVFIDKASGDAYAADPAGFIYRAVATDVSSGGKTHKEWRIDAGAVGTYDAFSKVGEYSRQEEKEGKPDTTDGHDRVDMAIADAIKRLQSEGSYNGRAIQYSLSKLAEARKKGDLDMQQRIIEALSSSDDNYARKVVAFWNDERKGSK